MEHLHDVEDHREDGHRQHEDDEDGFLSGTTDEAVHWRPTGVGVKCNHGRHKYEAIKVVLAYNEPNFKQDLGQQLQHVAEEQDALELHFAVFV